MKTVETSKSAPAIGPYNQGIITGNLLFTSGMIGLDPETGKVSGESVEAQTEQAIENLSAVLKAAGTDLTKVVKTTCFLADIADFAAFNGIYAKYFTGKPARSCFAVKDLPAGALCEIEAIAELE